jgi:hypothetical protein
MPGRLPGEGRLGHPFVRRQRTRVGILMLSVASRCTTYRVGSSGARSKECRGRPGQFSRGRIGDDLPRADRAVGFAGIAAGREILILTWLHETARDALLVHPRDDPAQPITGVFATRSADRPNPSGCTGPRSGRRKRGGAAALDLKHALPEAGGW